MSKESAMAMATGTAVIPSAQPTSSATAPVVSSEPNEGVVPAETAAPQVLESTRFAQLAKKEAELQKQREEFKRNTEQFNKEKESLRSVQKTINDFEQMRGKDPVAALKILGFSDTEIFNFYAQSEDNSTPEEKAAKAANKEIQKFRDEETKKQTDAQEKRNTETLQQFRENISKHVTADKDKYEYINYNGPLAEELVYETVAEVLKLDNVIISIQEAADMVENYYEEQDKGMSILKKRQSKAPEAPAPAAPAPEEPLKPQVSPRPSAGRTLSSKTSATVASTVPAPRNETPDQKKARLINKYLGPKQ